MTTKKYIKDIDLEVNIREVVRSNGRLDSLCGSCEGFLVLHTKGSCTRKEDEKKKAMREDKPILWTEISQKMVEIIADPKEVKATHKEMAGVTEILNKMVEHMTNPKVEKKETQTVVKSKGPPSWNKISFPQGTAVQ